MKIYIASSWSNQTAVELLTIPLRHMGHIVTSFVEDGMKRNLNRLDFKDWIETDDAEGAFEHDSEGAMNSDIVIYIAPSGKDAAAEVGMAYARKKFLIALWAKKEDFGLMRKIFSDRICGHYTQVLKLVEQYTLNYEQRNSQTNE